jgi:flagellar hook protein FlgE
MIGPLNIDMSHSTNYASAMSGHASTITVYRGDDEGLNKGYANGDMTGLSVTDNGSVFAKYSNGQEVKIAQIAVAEFSNAMGLELVGNNLYAESLNSGNPMIMDITSDGGYFSSGVLESSNVDLAKEFTDMITTQRGFQANSRVITTSDELLQIIKGLKR